MIKIQGIDHVAFNVRDLDKTVKFYTEVIGLKITTREPSKPGIEYFLDCGPSLLGIIQANDLTKNHPFSHEGLGANHFSFRIHSNDFVPMIEHLEKHDVKIEYAKKRPKSWSLYFYDVDENKLEATAWPLEDGLPESQRVKEIYDSKQNHGRLTNMSLPQEGNKAPDFNLPASTGANIALKNLKGKNVVVYFYPKDDTPGCTVEACGLRDSFKKIEKLNTVILGVSPDSVKSHGKFITKFQLPFALLADEDKKMCQDYGVWVEKSMYGKKYMGVARTTFIIDANGKIAKVFEKVKPEGHNEEIITALKTL